MYKEFHAGTDNGVAIPPATTRLYKITGPLRKIIETLSGCEGLINLNRPKSRNSFVYLIPEVDGNSVVTRLETFNVVPPEYRDEEEVSRFHHRFLTSGLGELWKPREIRSVKVNLQDVTL